MNFSPMLKSVLFIFINLFIIMSARSQQPVKNYTKEWSKAEAFIQKGLPKSALEEVRKIYLLAKKEKQDAQLVKSLLYISRLQVENREENSSLSIAEMEKEISVWEKQPRNEPILSLLRSVLASQYQQYYQENQWELYNRTTTEKFIKTDIATWGTMDFHQRISQLFLQSVQQEKILLQTKLSGYDAIITKGNVRHLRPTLYDLLAFRAIQYFESGEINIKKPAYAFEISQASAFDPAADFSKRKFTSTDSLSLEHKALLLYQKLITLHLKDAKPDALIDADLLRLQFVKNKSTHPEKEKLYFNAVNHIARQYGNLPAASQSWYLLAKEHDEQANSYLPHGDSTHRFDRLKAKEICEKVLQQKDSSLGKINCYNLLNEINRRSFEFVVEKVNLPGQPFRSLVKYKNIQQLYFRIIRADAALRKLLENQYDKNYWPSLVAAKAEKSWQQIFPDTKDHQRHSAEIKIEGLPAGEYILLASGSNSFDGNKTLLGARLFYVSSISYVNSSNDYFVLHRETGQPLVNANVQIWEQRYDYSSSKNIKEKTTRYSTDANGYFRLERKKPDNKNYGNTAYTLEIMYRDDRLFLDDLTYDYYYNNQQQEEDKNLTSIHLFTDRSIYRPGQTLHFKGIVLQKNSARKTGGVRADYTSTIYLRDANYQDIDSIRVHTNEYGSFSGKFQLPQSGMNGQFSIYTKKESASNSFRVEEYKRPKFYVDYETVKGTYKVNDKIRVTGFARAYAGNNIDGASVKYRIVREPRFIYPWIFWRWWQPPGEEMEIAHGEIKTDKDGKFVVEFIALPDGKIDKKFDPVFDYRIYADITDINGETRSGEKTVSVSYKSLMLVTTLPSSMPADSLRMLSVFTQNMNGEHEPAHVTVRIQRLQEEKRLIRERFWERPDQFVMEKEAYQRHFPHDEYDNESDYKSWATGKELYNKTDSSRSNGEWKLTGLKPEPGFYVFSFTTKDKNGEEVKDVKYIELFDEKSAQLNQPAYLWTGSKKTSLEPGETGQIELGTASDSLFVIHQINKAEATGPYQFLALGNQKKTFSFKSSESDRGGFGASWMFVKNNRFFQHQQQFSVPWTNKELKVEYASFRDKTLPGSEEKWKIKITGYKKELVAAEMLATMYDASLDQFEYHGWSSPSIWPYFGRQPYWSGSQNFNQLQSHQKNINEFEYKYADKQYDMLFSNSAEGDLLTGGYRNPRLYRVAAPAPSMGNEVMAEDAVADEKAPGEAKGKDDGAKLGNAGTGNIRLRGETGFGNGEAIYVVDGVIVENINDLSDDEIVDITVLQGPAAAAIFGPQANRGAIVITTKRAKKKMDEPKIRKNFNETAFFFPELRTDSSGAIEFSFTMPEALTKWKFMALAHTKEAAFGSSTKEIATQKDLMVQPNPPRFLREGDKMEFSSKVVNLTDKEITGTAEFQLFDAATNEPVDGRFRSVIPNQYFTVAARQSELVKFPIEVPYQFNKALVWRILVRAGVNSDGEENVLPVLTNRMLVTETMPLAMRGAGSKDFSFTKLLQSGSSESLQQHALTIEYTSNPAWYAVQSLPYLMEYPYDCAEQTWNRYYANSLATYIANSSPKIREVFEKWRIKDTAALMSNLQKNQELKAVLLEETPWVLEAKNEAAQKRNIALLFDMIRMSEQLNSAYEKLSRMQSSNGGFVWFTGGPDDRYMTQYIVTGIGHLFKLKSVAKGQEEKLKSILQKAIPYLDQKIKQDYDDLIRYKTNLKNYTPGYSMIQYLYMRSFFPDYPVATASRTAYDYFRGRAQLTWVSQSKYMQGMISLALHRTGDAKTTAAILKSLKETSLSNEELGMYWKDQSNGWFWHQAPIETQSLLIEAFQEAGNDEQTVNELRTWLLKNKQTNHWKTTRATAEACYALLLQGNGPASIGGISNEPVIDIQLGNYSISSKAQPKEAGTGYFKQSIEGNMVKPEMGNIKVTVSKEAGNNPGWGAAYWQYFEDLDKITVAATPLKLNKKLFVEKNTDRGPVLTPVNDGDVLKVGDKIKVRVELRVDRDMEYVHMKDMRASALEPVNVLSQYKWQGGLGYYESTKDASTNFFFHYLTKGTYVFEYPLFVTHTGNFSNGITSIQCMYAPEFSAHSEGIRITVE